MHTTVRPSWVQGADRTGGPWAVLLVQENVEGTGRFIQKALPDLQFLFQMLNEKTVHFLKPSRKETGYQQLPNCYTNNLALTKANFLFFKCSEFFKN